MPSHLSTRDSHVVFIRRFPQFTPVHRVLVDEALVFSSCLSRHEQVTRLQTSIVLVLIYAIVS